ncbi:hypothetical protein Tco_1369922 [Tanacetum coccineum]
MTIEDCLSYINVSESAQDRDVGLGEADSKTSPKRSLLRKIFKTCCMNWGEVNPVHAYYNGSKTSKDNEDPSWSTRTFRVRYLNLFLVCLGLLFHLAILCLDQHAHTLHHLESLLTISLDRLDILEEDLFEHEHVVMNPTHLERVTGFLAQSVRSSNADALDSLYLLVLNTGTSQSRQHGKIESDSYYLSDKVITSFTGTSLIHIESHHRWNLACHLPRACLMLAQAGFPSSL